MKYGTIQNHPYFLDDYWEEGQIVYDGQAFDSVYMMYEIYSDLVLVESFSSKGALSVIKLHSPLISSFKLLGHTFIRLQTDSLQNIQEGFYDLLYDGEKLQLYSRRIKMIVKDDAVNSVAETFTQKDKFYLKKDGQYFQVKKKKSVLKVLHDRKKELKAFARSNQLFFSSDQERSIMALAEYYDNLK